MINALAFLPLSDVHSGMDYLQSIVPDHIQDLLDYFNATYVNWSFRKININEDNMMKMKVRCISPLFPPSQWNVHDATLAGTERTDNIYANHGILVSLS